MEKEVMLTDRISEILGRGSARSSIISSASLAVVCLFYVYTVGTQLQIRIYPLIDRVTYYIPFNFYIVNEFVDQVVIGTLLVLWVALSVRHRIGHIVIGVFAALFAASAATNYDAALDGIALSALPAIVSILIYDRYSSRKILQSVAGLTRNYLAIIGIITGLISLGFAISSIAFPSDNEVPVRSYAHDIFLLFSSFSPVLLLLLITCYPVKLLIDYVRMKARRPLQPTEIVQKQVSRRAKMTYLSLFVLLSIVIAIIPHLPTVNEDSRQVGVDTGFYVNWVGALNNSTNPSEFLYNAFVDQGGDGDRPVSLIFIYALQQITNADLFAVVEYLPLILGPGLVLAIYFLTRELTSNDTISLLAAFLTAISFHVLIGIYAGFYANWLALIFGYLGFVFLFRFLKRGGTENLALYGGLTLLTLFSHVYTWSILAIVTGIFLAVMLKMNYKRNATLLLIVLFSTVGVDLARTGLTGSSSGLEEDIEIAGRLAGPEQFVLRWNNLTYTTTTFVGGLFANFILLALGLYWLFKAKTRDPISIFIIVFLSVGILPFLFGEWVIQTRVFYNIPFQIPAAIALFHIGRQSGGFLKTPPIYIWLIAMSMLAVSNFYLVAPQS